MENTIRKEAEEIRKSKFASICLFVPLAILLINILVIVLIFKTSFIKAETIPAIYNLMMLLSAATFIASIVSLIRVAISKKQLKGIAKSITGMVLSIVLLVAALVQGIFAEVRLASKDILMSEGSLIEEEQESIDSNIPKFVKKDFDAVAVAKYYNEDEPGYKVGFIDKTGDLVIEAKFEDAEDFYEGLAPVKLDGKWGYIDKTGEFVIQPQFDRADIFCSGVAIVEVDDKYGYIDKNGDYIFEPILEKAVRFNEGLTPLVLPGDDYVGVIDTTGKFVIEPTYLGANYFSDGVAFVVLDLEDEIFGLVDRDGNFKQLHGIGLSYDYEFSEGLLQASKPGEGNGYIDKTGEFVIDPMYIMADKFSEGLAAVCVDDVLKKGFIDKNGNMVIEPAFYDCEPFSEGLALVVVKGDSEERLCGYIDKTGNYVIEPKFDNARSFTEGLALVRNYDEGYGFIDKTGKYVIEPREGVHYNRFHKVDGIYHGNKADIYEEERFRK